MMTRVFVLLSTLIWGFVATAPAAQTYPDYDRITVNDYADLLDPVKEQALVDQLDTLREETGVEMTVLTLYSLDPFAPDMTLEAFATGLFNHWGVGDRDVNDGVLVLVMNGDRAMRIELGSGYGDTWNDEAKHIVDNDFLPFFRELRYDDGIVAGVDAVIDQIVVPFHGGAELSERQFENRRSMRFLLWILGGFAATCVGGVFMILRLVKAMRKCPNCGKGGLNRQKTVMSRSTRTTRGFARVTLHCDHCDYREEKDVQLALAVASSSSGSRSGGSSFGGGSSSGGGASGRW